ncbi:terminase large subunit [Fibrisoma montanum]|uniref:Terminase large subunit n=1 Tax=Fibrisoma montanum TaxID=2305895 RepID=A0A418M3T1_9BACT|nr:terminase TerL endonuclease subunit [Fibrisoma montanum]RIV20314.1 terminase large subunit [Fibrisoma montanum]
MADFNRIALRYAEDVISGKQIVGKYIRLACERHLRDMERGKERGLRFDHAAGQQVIDFVSNLHHWKGAKARTAIELEPHQQFYLYSLFGWKRADGTRRFRKSYKKVARKNAKTTECAGKAMYAAYLDNEPGAQIYFVATKEDQARIGFKDVQEIIKVTPGLPEIFQTFTKSVVCPENSSFMKPLGSDSKTSDGFDPSYGIIDEYHAHPNDGMVNVIESGTGARRQPLLDIITTAGFNKQGPCFKFEKVVKNVLEGVLEDDALFGLIYDLDDDDLKDTNWQNEDVWVKANPNLHASVYLSNLRDLCRSARNEGGEKEVNFKTKNLNIWVDAAKTWITDENWMKGAGSFKPESLQGATCYGGLDLAVVGDFSALTLTFPMPDGSFRQLYYFWIPKDTVSARVAKGLSNLQTWVKDGFVRVTEGNVTDFDVIERDVIELCEMFNVVSIAYDRNLANQLVNNLKNEGVNLTEYKQTAVNFTPPTQEFERLILSGKLHHGNNPVMRWMMGNVVIKRDINGNVRPDKDRAADKIDGPVSSIMSIGEYLTFAGQPEDDSGSSYESEGIFYV